MSTPHSAFMPSSEVGLGDTSFHSDVNDFGATDIDTSVPLGDANVFSDQPPEMYFEKPADEVAPPPETIYSLIRPAFAECLGSAVFIFVACGSAMTTVKYQTPGSVAIGIALTFGFTIFVLCFTIGHISGGHLNCVVSFSFALLGKITPLRALLYFLAQFIGGLVGAGFLKAVTPQLWWNSCFASNFVAENATVAHAFWIEFFLTGILMLVICAATDSNKSNQTLVPLAIGVTITCCHMVGIPLTGTSLNPTRSFASAAVASGIVGCEHVWANHVVFWFAPLLGGISSSFLYEYVFHDGGRKFDNLVNQYRAKLK